MAVTLTAVPASAQQTAPSESDRLPEVVVTAQKRAQSINDVGLTVQALTSAALQNQGVQGPEDLAKVVPGFTFTKSLFGTPVYTLRGIGLYDATFGAVPAVAIYTDQVPRNFPVMSSGLDLDIERVEVLKGPQGTLFGQSSTGGAVNYIVNKPTKELGAGADFSYERFDKENFSGFLSGPITDALRARVALRAIQGGAWQYSASRPHDELGNTRKLEGRLTVDWQPNDQVSVENMFTAARDRSDPQAPQLVTSLLNSYSATALAAANTKPKTSNPYGVVDEAQYALFTTPGSIGYDATFLGRQATEVARLHGGGVFAAGAMGLLSGVNPGPTSRVAEWTPGLLGPSNNSYFQDSLQVDYKINNELTLTSISAYAYQKIDYNVSLDGTTAQDGNISLFGNVKTFNEELRLSGTTDRLNWIVGANYDDDRTVQDNFYFLNDYSQNAGGLISLTRNDFASSLKSYAGFANIDYKITSQMSANGGIRFTANRQTATYCYNDPPQDNAANSPIGVGQGTAFIFQNFLENPPNNTPIGPGDCFPISRGDLGTIAGKPTITPLKPKLNENNVSFRAGLNYKLEQGTLLYSTISQGYKAGFFSEIGASSTTEYTPAVQEKLIDYEVGFKSPFLDNRLDLNGAVFFYDYTNKQVRARVQDPVYGLLEKMINVPKSQEYGAELNLTGVPVQGLHLSLAGSYLYSRVTQTFSHTPEGLPVYTTEGVTGDFKGSALPFTPKFSGNADAEYEWSRGDKFAPFLGANVTYQGPENATFTTAALPATHFVIDGYGLLDVRAGVRAPDGKWQVMAYCHNITNKFYVTSISEYLDTRTRYVGQPAVYGMSFRVRFN